MFMLDSTHGYFVIFSVYAVCTLVILFFTISIISKLYACNNGGNGTKNRTKIQSFYRFSILSCFVACLLTAIADSVHIVVCFLANDPLLSESSHNVSKSIGNAFYFLVIAILAVILFGRVYFTFKGTVFVIQRPTIVFFCCAMLVFVVACIASLLAMYGIINDNDADDNGATPDNPNKTEADEMGAPIMLTMISINFCVCVFLLFIFSSKLRQLIINIHLVEYCAYQRKKSTASFNHDHNHNHNHRHDHAHPIHNNSSHCTINNHASKSSNSSTVTVTVTVSKTNERPLNPTVMAPLFYTATLQHFSRSNNNTGNIKIDSSRQSNDCGSYILEDGGGEFSINNTSTQPPNHNTVLMITHSTQSSLRSDIRDLTAKRMNVNLNERQLTLLVVITRQTILSSICIACNQIFYIVGLCSMRNAWERSFLLSFAVYASRIITLTGIAICMYLSAKFTKALYFRVCHCCHLQCYRCCMYTTAHKIDKICKSIDMDDKQTVCV